MRQTTTLTRLFLNLKRAVLCRLLEGFSVACILSAALSAQPLLAQEFVVTQSSTATAKKKPLDLVLRSIAVLEWTGPAGKPVASMLIPIAVYTNGQYMDGGAYLAQPVPLAVQQGTQYILEKTGVPQGDYAVDAAEKMRGAWFGSGTWKPLQQSRSKIPAAVVQDTDRPRFSSSKGASKPDTGSTSSDDAVLPTLHLRPPVNPATTPPPDPDRPLMTYGKPVPAGSDRSPADLSAFAAKPHQQMVAISDAAERDAHSLAYQWNSTDQKEAMQQKVEVLAQKFLQPSVQPKPAAAREPEQKSPAPETLSLSNIDFRCFALTYEKKASEEIPTCVFSAETPGKDSPMRFITVIAQPDIYGVPQAISHGETDASQLTTRPRVRLVDAVNATGGQNGELLFEIDGQSQRRFALYTVSDGHVALVYVTRKLPF